jgi:hypothetical protein
MGFEVRQENYEIDATTAGFIVLIFCTDHLVWLRRQWMTRIALLLCNEFV